MLFEMAGKGRNVFETAGQGDLGDAKRRIAQHEQGLPQPVQNQVLLGRDSLFFYKKLIQIGPVNPYVRCDILYLYFIAVIVVNIGAGLLDVKLSGGKGSVRGFRLHEGTDLVKCAQQIQFMILISKKFINKMQNTAAQKLLVFVRAAAVDAVLPVKAH